MDIGPAPISVYNVAAANAAVTTTGSEESAYSAGNYIVTGSLGLTRFNLSWPSQLGQIHSN